MLLKMLLLSKNSHFNIYPSDKGVSQFGEVNLFHSFEHLNFQLSDYVSIITALLATRNK